MSPIESLQGKIVPDTRIETDHLGNVTLSANALYGANTFRGYHNLGFSQRSVGCETEFAKAFAQCKLAAARTNGQLGIIAPQVAEAIARACQDLMSGMYTDQLLVDVIEGSGGTSTNMNFNEVIANRAQQLLGGELGKYDRVHPNDHVNRSQSTNDVYPSAMKIAVHARLTGLADEIDELASVFDEKADEFKHILHLGRTCLQDAQPMYLGQRFQGYAALTHRLADQLREAQGQLLDLPLGATAIGTGFGSPPGYKDGVFAHLREITGVDFSPANDPFDAMQNMDAFSRVSAELRTIATAMGKVASDLILLSSGPVGGIGEILLPPVQAGSSIMPGKVNPVVAIGIVQLGYAVVGNDVCVAQSAQAGQLEINHFEPIILSRVSDSISLLNNGIRLFRERCVKGLRANEERNVDNVLRSSAVATAFIPKLGYDVTAAIVHEAHHAGRSFVEQMVEKGYLTHNDSFELVKASAYVVPSSA
ncbi:aspartate ammonia-lyase [Alcaligenaceae bacterium]|nr:aspartate ammonia-lyase [Alcaligenaceae bacterium]